MSDKSHKGMKIALIGLIIGLLGFFLDVVVDFKIIGSVLLYLGYAAVMVGTFIHFRIVLKKMK